MTMTTPSHGPKPYPSSSVEGDLWLREYVTALPLSSDYWLYDPDKDLWYGDSDDDFTPITDVHNYPSGASSRRAAVGFSTGERGFLLTGTSGTSYFDDVYELLPDEEEEV